jgi:hypothetical protein
MGGVEVDGGEANAIAAGVKVWVPDATDAWVAAEVVSVRGDRVTVSIGAGTPKQKPREKELGASEVALMEKSTEEDMVRLNYLHEPGVLHNLGNRYSLDEIYTYTGSILIAVRTAWSAPPAGLTPLPLPAPHASHACWFSTENKIYELSPLGLSRTEFCVIFLGCRLRSLRSRFPTEEAMGKRAHGAHNTSLLRP